MSYQVVPYTRVSLLSFMVRMFLLSSHCLYANIKALVSTFTYPSCIGVPYEVVLFILFTFGFACLCWCSATARYLLAILC